VEVVEEVCADEVEVLVHERHGARGKTGSLGGQGRDDVAGARRSECVWYCGGVVVLVLSADGY
jgi:hypothetical protein